jgi:heme/copper-type cytochrome/quinol oxidase subunit 3
VTPISNSPPLRVASDLDRSQVLSNGVLAMLLFVISETILFGGMISGFLIIQAVAPIWPPPGQPRLPVEATGFNTGVLFLSAFALANAHRLLKRKDRHGAQRSLTWALALGAFFVIFQGYEWVQLIYEGLTITSSTLGAFFYLIVGMHALHAIAALCAMAYTWAGLRAGWLVMSQLATAEVLWYFVVAIWPIIYGVVYLS